MNFKITERNILRTCKNCIVGDNSDYIASFEFDDEWIGKIKTARFCHGGTYLDVILDENNTCLIPSEKSGWLQVGVYTADMTTTSCSVYVVASVKDLGTPQPAPAEDIYQQLLEMIEQGTSMLIIKAAIADYMTEHHDEFKGDQGVPGLDGYSPTFESTKSGKTTTVVVTDKDGDHQFGILDGDDGQPGDPGQDGFSPSVSTSKVGKTTTVEITDKTGKHSFDILDGSDGQPGQPGHSPIRGTDYWTAEDQQKILDDAKTSLAIKNTASGTNIVLNDSADAIINKMVVYGINRSGLTKLPHSLSDTDKEITDFLPIPDGATRFYIRFLADSDTKTGLAYYDILQYDSNFSSVGNSGLAKPANNMIQSVPINIRDKAMYYKVRFMGANNIAVNPCNTLVVSEFMLTFDGYKDYVPYTKDVVISVSGTVEGQDTQTSTIDTTTQTGWENLKTYYPSTTIIPSVDATMDITYIADTKNYIDKKIEQL